MYIDTMSRFYDFISDCEVKGRKITKISQLPQNLFPITEVCYIRALLEAQFSPRKFTYFETLELINEVYPDYFAKIGNSLIPKWYKDKYFKRKKN